MIKVSKGHVSIRRRRHPLQAGDIVMHEGQEKVVKTCRTKTPKRSSMYEAVEFTCSGKQYRIDEHMKVKKRIGGWVNV